MWNTLIIIRLLGLAEWAQEEPLSNKGREDNAGDHHQDDPHTGDQPMQEDESGFWTGFRIQDGFEKTFTQAGRYVRASGVKWSNSLSR